MGAVAKTDRLEARVRPEAKAAIERAAEILGVTVSSFVVESAQARAVEVIRNFHMMELSTRDSRLFAAAVLDAGEPNDALQAALRRYVEQVEVRP